MGTSKLLGKPAEINAWVGGGGGSTCEGLGFHPGGLAILVVTSCCGGVGHLSQLCRLTLLH